MVYSRGDAGVVPPRPLRNQLPSVEPYDGVDPTAGTLTLLIDERGRVEQVTLNSPGNRFRERMIVSAAKAWMFRPATKDGRPVRYRLILKITDWERQPF